MRVRTVTAGSGWRWILEGVALFRRAPLMWVALTLVLALIWMLMLLVRIIGPLLFNLVSPIFFAGFMVACRDLEEGREVELGHLFSAFRSEVAAPLVTVGGVYLVGLIAIIGLIVVMAGGSMPAGLLAGKGADPAALAGAARGLALAVMVGFAIYIPLIMAVWFAPLLVAFHGMSALAAMKLSFTACSRNFPAFAVYGVVVMGLWALASIPLLLGLLVVLPVVLCSMYASYRDVFEDTRENGQASGVRRQE
jgi:uncharacterized membrane protein